MYSIPQTYTTGGFTYDLYHVCYNTDSVMYFDYQYYGDDLPVSMNKYVHATARIVNFHWRIITSGQTNTAPSCSQSNLIFSRGYSDPLTHFVPAPAQPNFLFGIFLLLAFLCVGLFKVFKR